jgi:hypothetical protein
MRGTLHGQNRLTPVKPIRKAHRSMRRGSAVNYANGSCDRSSRDAPIVAVEHEPQDLGRIESGERLLKEFPPIRWTPMSRRSGTGTTGGVSTTT